MRINDSFHFFFWHKHHTQSPTQTSYPIPHTTTIPNHLHKHHTQSPTQTSYPITHTNIIPNHPHNYHTQVPYPITYTNISWCQENECNIVNLSRNQMSAIFSPPLRNFPQSLTPHPHHTPDAYYQTHRMSGAYAPITKSPDFTPWCAASFLCS